MARSEPTSERPLSQPYEWITHDEPSLVSPDAATLLRQAQELTGLCFVHVDLVKRRRHISPNFQKVVGAPVPNGLQDLLVHVHPDDRERFVAADSRAFTLPGRHSSIYRVVLPTGEVRWIESISNTECDGAGRPVRVLLTCRNMSDAPSGPIDANASIEQLRRVQSAAKVGVWETDLVSGKEVWSREAWELVEPGGMGEATTERWLAAVHPDDRERALESYCMALETGSYDDEYRIVHPDGNVRWHHGIATVERDAAGKPTLMRGVVIDVTERRQAKDTLARLASIIDASPDFVGWADLGGRCVYVNPAGRRMCGVGPADDLVGRPILEFVAPHHHEQMTREVVPSTLRDGIWAGEIDMADRHGRVFPVSKVQILHRDSAGRPLYISTVCRDISDLRRSEAALREADRRKDEFLATLAHELRNPLAPLQTVTDMMRQFEVADPRLVAARRIVEEQTTHLTRLVEDLLDVSRLASGKLTLKKAPAAIGEAVAAALDMCCRDIEARGHRVERSLPDQPLLVDGDLFRLTQVLANLLGNAAKYTPPGGLIRIRADRDGAAVCIAVEDNGIGIEADFLPKVFDAFAQAQEHREKVAGGLGLGLMLVKQIVELHGGTVAAASAGLGRGSRFEVRLPLTAAPARASRPGEAVTPSLRSVGCRVLVVDDYAAIRDSLELMLTMRGFVVETAADGPAALAKLAQFKADAVLLDWRLPGTGGGEVAREMRKLPQGAGLRLVAMSGNGTEQDRDAARAAGCDAFTIKPVGIDKLVDLLCLASLRQQAVA